MRMGQGVRTGLGHGGITCVLQTQFSGWDCFGRKKTLSYNWRNAVYQTNKWPCDAVGSPSDSKARGPTLGQYLVRPHTFVSPYPDSRKAVVSYWRKYVHKVLVNHLESLNLLPRKTG